jgi:hypothetical protein
MKRLLWLDDIRNPNDKIWMDWITNKGINPTEFQITWVKNFDDFISFIKFNGLPDLIFFDHDLGEDVAVELVKSGVNKKKARMIKREAKSGFDCAKWLVEYCLDNKIAVPEFDIQSANPVGAENIRTLLNNYNKHYK